MLGSFETLFPHKVCLKLCRERCGGEDCVSLSTPDNMRRPALAQTERRVITRQELVDALAGHAKQGVGHKAESYQATIYRLGWQVCLVSCQEEGQAAINGKRTRFVPAYFCTMYLIT